MELGVAARFDAGLLKQASAAVDARGRDHTAQVAGTLPDAFPSPAVAPADIRPLGDGPPGVCCEGPETLVVPFALADAQLP